MISMDIFASLRAAAVGGVFVYGLFILVATEFAYRFD